jgi:hypothetical protein
MRSSLVLLALVASALLACQRHGPFVPPGDGGVTNVQPLGNPSVWPNVPYGTYTVEPAQDAGSNASTGTQPVTGPHGGLPNNP